MHALDGIPGYLIPIVREALATQGINRSSITDAGDIDAALMAVSLMDTVTIRTNITPDLTIDVKDAALGPSSPVTRALQPTLILKGGAVGSRVIAPHGESRSGGLVFVGIVALLAAGAWRYHKRQR